MDLVILSFHCSMTHLQALEISIKFLLQMTFILEEYGESFGTQSLQFRNEK